MNTLVIMCALVCAATAGTVRDKRWVEHGLASFAAPVVSYSAPAVSYTGPALSYAAPALSLSAPASRIVSVNKVVNVQREVSVPEVVHVRKVISEPKIVTVNKLVPAESYSSLSLGGLYSAAFASSQGLGYASGWW